MTTNRRFLNFFRPKAFSSQYRLLVSNVSFRDMFTGGTVNLWFNHALTAEAKEGGSGGRKCKNGGHNLPPHYTYSLNCNFASLPSQLAARIWHQRAVFCARNSSTSSRVSFLSRVSHLRSPASCPGNETVHSPSWRVIQVRSGS